MIRIVSRAFVALSALVIIVLSFVAVIVGRQEKTHADAVSLFVDSEIICAERFYDRARAIDRVAHYQVGLDAIRDSLQKTGVIVAFAPIPQDAAPSLLRIIFARELERASVTSRRSQYLLAYEATQAMTKWFRDSHTSVARQQFVFGPPAVMTRFVDSNILVLSIREFSSEYRHVFPAVVSELKQRQSLGAIIDLRNSVGGDIDTLCSLLSCFIPRGTPLFLLLNSYVTEAKVVGGSHSTNLPIVVLVNNQSYSAAEMFAEVVQRTKRGVVVGERTPGSFGVATQHLIDPLRGVILQVTERTHRTFIGESLESIGVTPDVVVADSPTQTGGTQFDVALVELKRFIVLRKK